MCDRHSFKVFDVGQVLTVEVKHSKTSLLHSDETPISINVHVMVHTKESLLVYSV